MKFRIFTNGKQYRVQRKRFLTWVTLRKNDLGQEGFYNDRYMFMQDFSDKKKATEWIREHYGSEAKIVEYWRPC